MTFEEIKNKIQYGDFNILGEVLKVNSPAARTRFLRKDPVAISLMTKIIENRENFIQEHKIQ